MLFLAFPGTDKILRMGDKKKMAKKMATKVLFCLVVIAILVSVMPASIVAANSAADEGIDVLDSLSKVDTHEDVVINSEYLSVKSAQTASNIPLGIYVDPWNEKLKQKNQGDLINELKQQGIARIFVTVYVPSNDVHGRGVFFIEKVGVWNSAADPRVTYEPYDITTYYPNEENPYFFKLTDLIREAHKKGLEVHATINCFGSGLACSKPISPTISPKDYVYQLHLREVISYITKNYNVDGIHLDYIRFIAESALGKTEFIENFLSDINSDGSLGSDQFLSAAVFPADGESSYSDVMSNAGQDYSKMSQYLDFICPMAYHYPDHDASWVGDVTKFVKQKVNGDCLVIPDIQTFKNDKSGKEPKYRDVKDAISSAIENGANGINIFRYGTTSEADWRAIDDFFHPSESPDFTPIDLCMVLDRSGSMDESMGGKTRMQGVKEAAKGVVNVLLPLDRVSLVSFSETATANIDLTSNFNAVKTKTNAIKAGGGTSFGAGLDTALDQFNTFGDPEHTPAILFMSDGEHNRAPDPEAYVTQCKNKGIPIFTVGFATSESEVDVTKLKMMSEETGGEYHFVSETFDLQNIFLRLQHKASGWESVAAYVGEVNEGETITAGTFYVDPAIDDLRVTLNWPGSNLDLELFDPSSRQVDFSASNVIYSGDTKPEYVIIKDPQSGTWTAKVYGKSIGSSEAYYVLVTKYEPSSPLPPPKCKVQITSNPSLQDRPSIVHVNGNYYIAYQSHEKGYGIYIKEFDSNWKFKKKVEVASGSAYYDSPSLLFANNKLYVAYITNANGANANDYDVIVKEYNPSSLSCTKGAKFLTSLQSCQDLPAIYHKDGYFYMAYQSWEKGDGDIFIKKFDSNLNMLKKVQVTSKSSLQDRPSITYANGYFYVAYFSEETGYYDIFVKRLDSNLNLASWKEQITTKSSYQSYPFITFVNNQFAISYASTESGTLGIYMKKYNSNWNFIEKTKVIDSSAYERRPSHTWDGSNFWISYVYNQGDSKDWDIFAIRPNSECGSVHYRGLE